MEGEIILVFLAKSQETVQKRVAEATVEFDPSAYTVTYEEDDLGYRAVVRITAMCLKEDPSAQRDQVPPRSHVHRPRSR